MWIVKNETTEPVALQELGLEVPGKEYLDLDAHGRGKAEAASSVLGALSRGELRTLTKTAPEPPPAPTQPATTSRVLRDLADNPPLPSSLRPVPSAPSVGVREAFRRLTARKGQKDAGEDPPPTPEIAALRRELERFRRDLLEEIQRLLEAHASRRL